MKDSVVKRAVRDMFAVYSRLCALIRNRFVCFGSLITENLG